MDDLATHRTVESSGGILNGNSTSSSGAEAANSDAKGRAEAQARLYDCWTLHVVLRPPNAWAWSGIITRPALVIVPLRNPLTRLPSAWAHYRPGRLQQHLRAGLKASAHSNVENSSLNSSSTSSPTAAASSTSLEAWVLNAHAAAVAAGVIPALRLQEGEQYLTGNGGSSETLKGRLRRTRRCRGEGKWLASAEGAPWRDAFESFHFGFNGMSAQLLPAFGGASGVDASDSSSTDRPGNRSTLNTGASTTSIDGPTSSGDRGGDGGGDGESSCEAAVEALLAALRTGHWAAVLLERQDESFIVLAHRLGWSRSSLTNSRIGASLFTPTGPTVGGDASVLAPVAAASQGTLKRSLADNGPILPSHSDGTDSTERSSSSTGTNDLRPTREQDTNAPDCTAKMTAAIALRNAHPDWTNLHDFATRALLNRGADRGDAAARREGADISAIGVKDKFKTLAWRDQDAYEAAEVGLNWWLEKWGLGEVRAGVDALIQGRAALTTRCKERTEADLAKKGSTLHSTKIKQGDEQSRTETGILDKDGGRESELVDRACERRTWDDKTWAHHHYQERLNQKQPRHPDSTMEDVAANDGMYESGKHRGAPQRELKDTISEAAARVLPLFATCTMHRMPAVSDMTGRKSDGGLPRTNEDGKDEVNGGNLSYSPVHFRPLPVPCAAAHYDSPHKLILPNLRERSVHSMGESFEARDGDADERLEAGGGARGMKAPSWLWEAKVLIMPVKHSQKLSWVIVAPTQDGCDVNDRHQVHGESNDDSSKLAEVQVNGAHEGENCVDGSENDASLNRESTLSSEAVAVVARGGCSFAQKAAVAQAQGFAALLIIDPILSIAPIEGSTTRSSTTAPAAPAIGGDGHGGDPAVGGKSDGGTLHTPMVGGSTSERNPVTLPVVMALGLLAASSVSPSHEPHSHRTCSSWATLQLQLAHESQPTVVDIASAVSALEPEAAARLAEGFGSG